MSENFFKWIVLGVMFYGWAVDVYKHGQTKTDTHHGGVATGALALNAFVFYMSGFFRGMF